MPFQKQAAIGVFVAGTFISPGAGAADDTQTLRAEKYCAVKVSKGGAAPGNPGYGKGAALGEIYG